MSNIGSAVISAVAGGVLAAAVSVGGVTAVQSAQQSENPPPTDVGSVDYADE